MKVPQCTCKGPLKAPNVLARGLTPLGVSMLKKKATKPLYIFYAILLERVLSKNIKKSLGINYKVLVFPRE